MPDTGFKKGWMWGRLLIYPYASCCLFYCERLSPCSTVTYLPEHPSRLNIRYRCGLISGALGISVVDPDPYWIRIQELPVSGSVFGIRIHTCKIQNWLYYPGSGSGPGSGSKLGQNPGSGSKFNVFGSTTLLGMASGTGIWKNQYPVRPY